MVDSLSEETKKLIGERIMHQRKSNDFDVKEASRLTNISIAHIHSMERGENSISLDVLMCLCKHYQCTPNDILLGESKNPSVILSEPNNKRNAKIKILNARLPNLNIKELNILIAVSDSMIEQSEED